MYELTDMNLTTTYTLIGYTSIRYPSDGGADMVPCLRVRLLAYRVDTDVAMS